MTLLLVAGLVVIVGVVLMILQSQHQEKVEKLDRIARELERQNYLETERRADELKRERRAEVEAMMQDPKVQAFVTKGLVDPDNKINEIKRARVELGIDLVLGKELVEMMLEKAPRR